MALKMRNIITLLLILAGGAQAALTNDFVGYYEFDGNGNDTSGSSTENLGTLHGSSANFSGSALFGSGSLHVQNGDYCSLGNPTDYQFGTGSFTITYWLNTSANVSNDPTLVGNKNWSHSGGDAGFAQAIHGDDIKANAASGSRKDTDWVDLDPDSYFSDGQKHWTFVALVIDRNGNTMYSYTADEGCTANSPVWSSGTDGFDFGQDASSPATVDISGLGSLNAPSGYNLNIGQDGDGTGYTSLTANIDDMGIWLRALSRAELWNIYAEGRMNGKSLGYVVAHPISPPEVAKTHPVRVQFRDPHTAEVLWTSSIASDSIVEYGKTASLGLRKESTSSNTLHRVILDGLQWRTKYYYRIGHTTTSGEVFSPIYWFDNAINFSVMDASGIASPWATDGDTAAYTNAVRHILAATDIHKGYVLVYGIGDGRMLFELAKQSDLFVVGVDDNAARVAAVRAKLLEAGIYGVRVKLRYESNLSALPFSKDFFNLIVSGRAVANGTLLGSASEALRILRPFGGKLFMGAQGLPVTTIQSWYSTAGLSVTPVTDANGCWGKYVRGALAHAGWWSHQYGTAANNGYAGESLGHASSADDLQLQWLGRPGSDSGIDRNPRMLAPVSSHGRLYHQGYNRIMAMDSFNGAMLWSLEIPDFRRVNAPRDTSNVCADEDGLFLAVKNECWKLDGDTGDLVRRYEIDESGQEWGAVFRYKDKLIGSVVKEGSHYLKFMGAVYWADKTSGSLTDKVCSKSIFALNPDTGTNVWSYSNGIIVEPTICMGGDRVYFMECRNSSVVAGGGGRVGSALWQDLYLVALNADTGAVLWEVPISPAKGTVVTYMMYAPNSDQLVLSTSGTKYNLYTFNASNGTTGWSTSYAWYSNNHGGHMQRPVVIGDKVFMVPRLLNLADGTIINSSIGNSRSGCPTYSASSDALVYRGSGGTICMQDLNTGARDAWAKLRPSCWLNFTPTGGMLLVPEGAGGCSCNGWINTSVGFSTKE